ncbi:cobalamin biosynthesis protein [Beijerinckia indica]|uniref:Putative CobE protein n=1 Tax=Beijerinckia indica subsp. indica (strain ATCC 9039 / DSM 1715 / NCIMB 8712) TaxID=395963 RepID=B2IFH1_BEII9|nr:cobalamin biosynthesis protein [Beijerinckia indica]ACB97071.1 putative CobE protein [Beijerinckia indica subsp. indica ATCC 9039]
MIAIGLGCRKTCPCDDIVLLVHACLRDAALTSAPAGLFTIDEKREETGLIEAAAKLGLPLAFLDRATLAKAAPRAKTRSERVQSLFNLPSIAETAALAGAGEDSHLLLPRIARGFATCAIAESLS